MRPSVHAKDLIPPKYEYEEDNEGVYKTLPPAYGFTMLKIGSPSGLM